MCVPVVFSIKIMDVILNPLAPLRGRPCGLNSIALTQKGRRFLEQCTDPAGLSAIKTQ